MTVLTEAPTTPWQTRPGWGITVDLTPVEVVQVRRGRVLRRLVALALVVLLALCVGVTLVSRADRDGAQRAYDDQQTQGAAIRASATKYADIAAAQQVIAQAKAQASTLMADDVDLVGLMSQIRQATPPGVSIGNLTAVVAPAGTTAATTPGGATVIGTVTVSGTATQISDVAPFVAGLNRLQGVVEVVPTSTASTSNGTTFALTLSFTDVRYSHRFGTPAAATPGTTTGSTTGTDGGVQ